MATAGAAAHLVEQYPNESAAAAGIVAVPLLINLVFKSGYVRGGGEGGRVPLLETGCRIGVKC